MGRSGGKEKRLDSSKQTVSRASLKKVTENQKDFFESPTISLASQFHDDWRAGRLLEDGTYEPRIKTTKDEAWIAANGTDQVDIANTGYADLPSDWQAENKAAAEAVMDAALAEGDIEKMSSIIHDEWLRRNGEWAEDQQKLPYKELSEEEKEKDRVQAIAAAKVLEEEVNNFQKEIEKDIAEREKAVSSMASDLHDDWRAGRLLEDGTYEPRIKTTEDEAWIAANGTDQVDIANTGYADLPSDWQAENKAAAEAAYVAVKESSDIESAASKIHDKWLERNGEWAEDQQKLPYEELPEEEKEKDRAQVRAAIKTIPGLSLVEYPEGHEPRIGELREGVIKGNNGYSLKSLSSLEVSQSNFDQAESGLRFALDFSDEGRAIAEYARSRGEKTGDDPMAIIEDVYANPKKYEKDIPEVAENRSAHSGFSWGAITIGSAKSLVTPNSSQLNKEGNEMISQYIEKEGAKLKEAKRDLGIKLQVAEQTIQNLQETDHEKYAEEIKSAVGKALKTDPVASAVTEALQNSYNNSTKANNILVDNQDSNINKNEVGEKISELIKREQEAIIGLEKINEDVFNSSDKRLINNIIKKLNRRIKRYQESVK